MSFCVVRFRSVSLCFVRFRFVSFSPSIYIHTHPVSAQFAGVRLDCFSSPAEFSERKHACFPFRKSRRPQKRTEPHPGELSRQPAMPRRTEGTRGIYLYVCVCVSHHSDDDRDDERRRTYSSVPSRRTTSSASSWPPVTCSLGGPAQRPQSNFCDSTSRSLPPRSPQRPPSSREACYLSTTSQFSAPGLHKLMAKAYVTLNI